MANSSYRNSINITTKHPKFRELTEEYNYFLAINSSTIISYTGDFSSLKLQLLSAGIISFDDVEIFDSLPTGNQKCMQMIKCFEAKGINSIPDIIKCYKDTNNCNIVPELFESFLSHLGKIENGEIAGYNSNEDRNEIVIIREGGNISYYDFVVSDKHILQIIRVLENEITQSDWEIVLYDMLPKGVMQNVLNEKAFSLKLRKGIEAWIACSSKEDRRFSKLISIFENQDLYCIVDNLKDNSQKISAI